MLRVCVGIGVDGCRAYAVVGGCSSDPSMFACQLEYNIKPEDQVCLNYRKQIRLGSQTYRAISPLLAMSMELSGFLVPPAELLVVDTEPLDR